MRIEQLRLLVLKTAWLMDMAGNKGAHTEIQAIKIATPEAVEWILDKAIQVHGAGGLSPDFPLAAQFSGIRTLRFADGPDEVHKNSLARAGFGEGRLDERQPSASAMGGNSPVVPAMNMLPVVAVTPENSRRAGQNAGGGERGRFGRDHVQAS